MCRFLAYMGTPILLDQLIFEPENSLVSQSYHALERREPVNGDGFGLAWYVPEISNEPVRYVSVRPAWNDNNLRALAPKIRSGCVFAHVRDASFGTVSELNCHPFQFGRLLMMHNGTIEGFTKIKRALRHALCDEAYHWIKGETDSEHFFALFIHHLLKKAKAAYQQKDFIYALSGAVTDLKELFSVHKMEEDFYLNVAITDGENLIASRYDTNKEIESPTLYYSKAGRFECNNGTCRMVQTDLRQQGILIVSEPLTNFQEDWHSVPEEHFVAVSEELKVEVLPPRFPAGRSKPALKT